MSSDLREQAIERILRDRVSAIIRTADRRVAADAMRAAVAGGFRLVEFTLTTPGAYELVSEFAGDDRLLVGAGTVLTVAQARDAWNAGARFLVSPVCDPAVIAAAAELGAVGIPGTFTATEMQTAHRAGADFVKLFPAPSDVPSYVSAILGPLPHLRIVPTAGVTEENFVAILEAGAAGVGFVKPLFRPRELASRDYAAIERRARRIHEHLPAAAP